MHRRMALIGLLAVASCDGGGEPAVETKTAALSTTFHRLLHDDPAGGCDTRDYTNDGDWYPGFCKTECAAPATGISSAFDAAYRCGTAPTVAPLDPGPGPGPDPGSPYNYHFEEFSHLLACGNNTSPAVTLGTGYTLHFTTSSDRRFPTVGYDWTGGLPSGECDNFSAITGVASDDHWHGGEICSSHGALATARAYGIVGARCSNLAGLPGLAAVAANCQVLEFDDASVNEAGGGTTFVGTDWDYGFLKGECGDGRFIKGISHSIERQGSTRATKILCCGIQYMNIPS
jgi:hypothetical protein